MSVEQLAESESLMTHVHFAERDPQHHGWPSRGVQPLRLRILLSYHYYKDTDLDALFAKYFTEPYPEVFLDSGAFSAASQGAKIDLDAYCAYIERFKHLITTYAVLDVIGNAEATWRNQQRMEAKGLAPLPCFHVGEPFSYLERYMEHYPYIALGGMVPYMRDAKKKLMPWLIKCFKLAQGKSVFHGFGCTSWSVIKALGWYSVDSSSWGQGFRYGQIPLFDARAGRFVEARLGNKEQCYQYASLFRSLGFDPGDFADRKRNDRAKICAISALSYLHAEAWLHKRHGDIHIPSREGVGPKVHLAAGGVLGTPTQNASYYQEGLAQAHEAGLKLHLVAGTTSLDAPKGGNMSIKALSEAGLDSREPGIREIRADTSNGINYRDAQQGLRLYLAEATLNAHDAATVHHHLVQRGTNV